MSRLLILTSLLACLALLPAQETPYKPQVAPASGEGLAAIKRITVPAGLKIDLVAAEPDLANPVAFAIDEKGRIFVAETFRLHKGVTDNRSHMYWLDDEIACRTVADRVAMYRKHLKGGFKDYEKEHERVRLLEDTDGDGKVDKSTVFADGFSNPEDGIGAGLLARKGNVYFTCIPDLWLLRDTKGTGKADERTSLSTGYGVHVAFIGHDLHGLRIGPDGRLYFSCGDRGLNVKTKEGKQLFYPDTGAVLRCELDGSNLEVFATGLRNPQELAFDDLGNLFTVDNNSDAGDQARLVYIVEGGDSGWRMSYQYGTALHDEKFKSGNRGPWHFEKLWHLAHAGQPAYHLPPLAHFISGPSGLCYYPGIGMAESFQRRFFVCDFRGEAGNSSIWSFRVKPKGASFTLDDPQRFLNSVLATDCDFGPDSAFYVSDWVQGWGTTGKGRIYRISDPENGKKPAVLEARKLLAEGFSKTAITDLATVLGHPHQQVRQETQFELALRGKEATEILLKTAKTSEQQLARVHAIWALGQIGRKEQKVFEKLLPLLQDKDAEIRAQTVRVLADATARICLPPVAKLTRDAEPRVRFFAAQSLGRIAAAQDDTFQAVARGDLESVLRNNKNDDLYLRHAAVAALARLPLLIRDVDLASENPAAVRLGLVLALRRQGNRDVARFLHDVDPAIVAETARAIYDEPIPDALPDLARLLDNSRESEQQLRRLLDPALRDLDPNRVLFRALGACFRLGQTQHAAHVAAFAVRGDIPEPARLEAVRLLGEWTKPAGRDRLLGLSRPLPPRSPDIGADAFRGVLGKLFTSSDAIRSEAAKVAGRLGLKDVGPALLTLLKNRQASAAARSEALAALEQLRDTRLEEGINTALNDLEPVLRRQARQLLAARDPARALPLLLRVLEQEEKTPAEWSAGEKSRATLLGRQAAFAAMATIKSAEAQAALMPWVDRLISGEVPPALQLDVLEAVRTIPSVLVRGQVLRYQGRKLGSDPLAPFRETLEGGDARAGERLYFGKSELSCVRCHKIKGEGGDVGPELSGIAAKQKRDYLLESLVDPNKQIAKGFETVVLSLKNGKSVTGIIKAEDAASVKLITPEAQLVTIAKKDIEERQAGKSAMPEDLLNHLTLFELRDLVEFLASLK